MVTVDERSAGKENAGEESAGEESEREPSALAGAVDLLKALAAEVRLAVVAELAVGPRRVGELQAALQAHQREVSQPLLSQHLRVLRDAGMVTTTRVGTEITYRLADDRIAHLVEDAIHHASRAGTA